MTEKVILVNEQDIETGIMPKLEAHEKGLLHRAFSVFIINSKREILLQKRAADKYHSSNLWTNTCCSHPRPDEKISDAAHRRLKEEMGIDCVVFPAFNFIYKAVLDKGLIEHEYDHVFLGISDLAPILNIDEVSDAKYMDIDEFSDDVQKNPDNYTAWLKYCMTSVIQHCKEVLKFTAEYA